jgi:hypothetical protein
VYSDVYNLYMFIPFLTKVYNSEKTFVSIESERDFLMIDTMKQMNVKLNELELDECKIISPDWRVCKQTFPLKSTLLNLVFLFRILGPTRLIKYSKSVGLRRVKFL